MENQTLDTKALFAPKKGKEATKGQKQIYECNQETLKFYSILASGSLVLRLVSSPIFSPWTNLMTTIFALLIQACALGQMYYMAKPVFSGPSKTVVDGGIDLNLKAGFADNLKDLIITTAFCTGCSIFSNYFWLVWLWLPIYYCYKIWVSVIAPWIFEPAPEEAAPEIAEKKRKKMERKMARRGYR